ncbi:ATP-binding cassette subfamily C protein [Cryobacterium mesophilum]|uniref:ABC transporter ATP-binding protein n=1 Tax=Terrimesophilobacter mesophilus TaxID=433647 RepID=A0A4R8V9F2_9MICO|nr:ABC transporter ATP-binding protein [Terrimesophilobacter mesophilus]MBB5632669.1 ATP-binding cassette subfamily C protein [Terrimesophilobacter mesophilus]TFB79479.1 ABC transporter ATP-binding protein [Terrimesophilobacter mesophilus]
MLAAARQSLSFLSKRERVVYFSLVALRSLIGILDVFGIILVGLIASIGATQLNPDGGDTVLLGFTIPRLDSTGLLILVSGVLAVFVVKAVLAILLSWSIAKFISRVEARNADRLIDYLLRGSLANAKRYSKAEFQYAITAGSNWAFTGILNNVAAIITESFLLLVVAIAFLVVDPIAALFALAYFGITVVGMQYFIGRSLKRAGNDAADGTIDATNAISDTLDTFREISVLGRQELFLNRIHLSRRRIAKSGAVLQFLGGMPRYVVETALILGVVVFVGLQLLSGDLASGLATLGIFLAGGVRIMGSLLPLQTAVAALKINAERSRSALDLLAELPARLPHEMEPATDTVDRVTDGGLGVVISDARYRYSSDSNDTIDDISLQFSPGGYSAIIGPSGSGKTTLVDLILGLIRPDSGRVRIGGVEPNDLRTIAPGMVSYVPQKPGMVSGTIAENIALGVEPENIDQVRLAEVIKSAYLTDFIETLPDGVDTSVGKQVDALSGGQVQRIGLARALYVRPRLLILDEATSGLDASSEAIIGDSLRALAGTVTVIVIAHRLSTVQHADVVHVIEAGRVIASGDFKAVQKSVPMVAEYVKLMSFDEEPAISDQTSVGEG